MEGMNPTPTPAPGPNPARPLPQLGFVEAVKICLTEKFCNFEGRARRSEFWWFALANSVVSYVANLIGSYLIGVAAAFFALHPGLAPEWKLAIITGFLGSLTTFSTFSLELTTLVQSGRLGLAVGTIALHVGGSLTMTILGLLTVGTLRDQP